MIAYTIEVEQKISNVLKTEVQVNADTWQEAVEIVKAKIDNGELTLTEELGALVVMEDPKITVIEAIVDLEDI